MRVGNLLRYQAPLLPALLLALLVAPAAPAVAQNSYESLAVRPGGCFRGRPAERCRWFMISDAGFHYRLGDVVGGDERQLYHYALGLMVNNSPSTALGGLMFLDAEGELRGGMAVRWRKWLGRNSAIDLTGGIHVVGDASAGNVADGSPTIQARLVLADLIGVTARYDILAVRGGCRDPDNCFPAENFTSRRFYLGAEAGSWLGTTGILATGALIIVFLLTFDFS